MKNNLIICFGFDFEKSSNANAVCLYKILMQIKHESNFTVFTDGYVDEHYRRDSVTINRFYNGGSVDSKTRVNYFAKSVEDKIRAIYEIEKWDTVITISFPFQMVDLGVKIKNKLPQIKLISYLLDPYARNSALRYPKLLFPYRYVKELNVILNSDKVLIAEDLMPLYKTVKIFTKINKIVPLPLPLLEIQDTVIPPNSEGNIIKMVFAGSMDKKFRNPAGLLKFLKQIEEESKYRFQIDFYTNTKDVIPINVLKNHQSKIEIKDFVSKGELTQIMSDCHILINIGNKGLDHSMPSKIIEYVGFRKPILNYTFSKDDLTINFLQNYPLKFNIGEDNILPSTIKKFIEFLDVRASGSVEKPLIKMLYNRYLPENIAKHFIN